MEIKYEKLYYGRVATEGEIAFTVWSYKVDGCDGMLSIGCETGGKVEITFPAE